MLCSHSWLRVQVLAVQLPLGDRMMRFMWVLGQTLPGQEDWRLVHFANLCPSSPLGFALLPRHLPGAMGTGLSSP